MSTNRERILRRIRGFQAIAADQAGTPEGRAADALAARHIEKYHVAPAELEEIELFTERFTAGASEAWCRALLAIVARAHSCDSTHNIDSGMSSVYGDEDGVATVIEQFRVARKAIDTAWETWAADRKTVLAGLAALPRITPVLSVTGKRCERSLDLLGVLDATKDDFGMTVTTAIRRRLVQVRHASTPSEISDPADMEGTSKTRALVLQQEPVHARAQEHVRSRAIREEPAPFRPIGGLDGVLNDIEWLPKPPYRNILVGHTGSTRW